MNPKIAYKSSQQGYHRYQFFYSKTYGYEHWKWLDFDNDLLSLIEDELKVIPYVGHLDQPTNKFKFINQLRTIFSNDLLIKNLEKQNINENSLFSRVFKKIVSDKSNTFIYAKLNSFNRQKLFRVKDVGVFWYVIFCNNDADIEKLITKESINNDIELIQEVSVKALLFRDYLNNSISLIIKEGNIPIDHLIKTKDINMRYKKIDNIFDTQYIIKMSGNISEG